VEVRGVEPRSEMVYRSSIYMLSCRIEFRLKLCPVTRLPQTRLKSFTQARQSAEPTLSCHSRRSNQHWQARSWWNG